MKEDGSIVAWGNDFFGMSSVPYPNTNFVAIAANGNHSLAIADICPYTLEGDLDYDCNVNLVDFAMMAANWLIDCELTPDNPACIPR